MGNFVAENSIVRTIWGNSDLVLLVFAGSAAEFALNRAVDWLFFTNQLPQDPIGRLFSTALFAQEIVFVDEATAQGTLDRITAIHGAVEQERGRRIPDWAYRDVLYMLIDYSERAYRLLYRPLKPREQEELYEVYRRVGEGLRIPDLPSSYAEWQADRRLHLERDLAYSQHTAKLYEQYRAHLGPWRYALLLQVQALLAPAEVCQWLKLSPAPLLVPATWLYGVYDQLQLRPLIQWLLLPSRYLDQARQLDRTVSA